MKRTHLLFYYIVLNIFITIQEVTGFHTSFTCQLQFIDLKQEITSGDIEHALIDHNPYRPQSYLDAYQDSFRFSWF